MQRHIGPLQFEKSRGGPGEVRDCYRSPSERPTYMPDVPTQRATDCAPSPERLLSAKTIGGDLPRYGEGPMSALRLDLYWDFSLCLGLEQVSEASPRTCQPYQLKLAGRHTRIAKCETSPQRRSLRLSLHRKPTVREAREQAPRPRGEQTWKCGQDIDS